jgi:hypothetical protein
MNAKERTIQIMVTNKTNTLRSADKHRNRKKKRRPGDARSPTEFLGKRNKQLIS